MAVKIRPLSDRVIIKPDERPSVVGSIVVPGSASYRPNTGVVVEIGPGYVSEFPVVTHRLGDNTDQVSFPRMPMVLAPGMKVLFGKYSGAEIEIEDEHFMIMRQTEILCVLESEDAIDDKDQDSSYPEV